MRLASMRSGEAACIGGGGFVPKVARAPRLPLCDYRNRFFVFTQQAGRGAASFAVSLTEGQKGMICQEHRLRLDPIVPRSLLLAVGPVIGLNRDVLPLLSDRCPACHWLKNSTRATGLSFG